MCAWPTGWHSRGYHPHFDRFIRDEEHLAAVGGYIRENFVKAGLCAAAEEWGFGSASGEGRPGQRPAHPGERV